MITTAEAQINQMEFIRYQYLRPGFHAKLWEFEEGSNFDTKRYLQVAAPVTYSLAVGSRFGIDVIGSPFAIAIESESGGDISSYKMSDTFVRGSLVLGDDLALITLGVGIPSGDASLESDELAMAALGANRALNYPVANFGAGPVVALGVSFAYQVDTWVLGFGGGFALRREYEAVVGAEQTDFKPGNELNLTVGAERRFEFGDGEGQFLADFIYTNYSEDELQGQPFFEAGDKILLRGQVSLPLPVFNPVNLSILQRWRLDNRLSDNNATPGLLEAGGELELKAAVYLPASDAFSLMGLVQSQIYSDISNGSEGATINGFGGGFVLNISRHFTFDPTFIYLTGTMSAGPNTEIDITGLEARGGFAFRF
jgi:hypothetical protein